MTATLKSFAHCVSEQDFDGARELAQRQAGSERLVELCDCPYGCTHGVVLRDTTGRILQRGDHLVRGTRARAHHAIFYGGAVGSDVIHPARRRAERERRSVGASGRGGPGASLERGRGDGGSGRLLGVGRLPVDRQIGFTSLEEFGKGEGVYVMRYPPDPPDGGGEPRCLDADGVLHRARAELGVVGLDILHLSCEQFAVRCKTGTAASGVRPTRLRALRAT